MTRVTRSAAIRASRPSRSRFAHNTTVAPTDSGVNSHLNGCSFAVARMEVPPRGDLAGEPAPRAETGAVGARRVGRPHQPIGGQRARIGSHFGDEVAVAVGHVGERGTVRGEAQHEPVPRVGNVVEPVVDAGALDEHRVEQFAVGAVERLQARRRRQPERQGRADRPRAQDHRGALPVRRDLHRHAGTGPQPAPLAQQPRHPARQFTERGGGEVAPFTRAIVVEREHRPVGHVQVRGEQRGDAHEWNPTKDLRTG
jgi:hypothetical protein